MVFEVDPAGIAVHEATALVFTPEGRRCALAVDTAFDIRAV